MAEQAALWGGLTMDAAGSFPLSTDSILLADFAAPGSKDRVIDLGSGCGTLGLLLCGKTDGCSIEGLELQPEAHMSALENIRRNGLEGRLSSRLGDIRQYKALYPAGSFSYAISNPPYFPAGSGARAKGSGALARGEAACSLEDIFAAAAWLLRWGGRFCLVHRPERLADLMVLGRAHRLEVKRLRFVRHSPDRRVSLVLAECRLGAKPGLELLPELVLWDEKGAPTGEQARIYHL